ncbi:MAG: cytochrome C, partial [Verrucomicrobiota bacterium]|nr:cytochrome C [Verrucomicrobiota bacterium]
MLKSISVAGFFAFLVTLCPANAPDTEVVKVPNTIPLAPKEAMQLINLPKGFSLELVASEPQISEPVALTWDGNGRMY